MESICQMHTRFWSQWQRASAVVGPFDLCEHQFTNLSFFCSHCHSQPADVRNENHEVIEKLKSDVLNRIPELTLKPHSSWSPTTRADAMAAFLDNPQRIRPVLQWFCLMDQIKIYPVSLFLCWKNFSRAGIIQYIIFAFNIASSQWNKRIWEGCVLELLVFPQAPTSAPGSSLIHKLSYNGGCHGVLLKLFLITRKQKEKL